jgi:hypothetical protein
MRPLFAPLFAVGLLALVAPAGAQSDAELKRLDELDRKCVQAREAKLAPMRAELVERCVREEKRPRDLCTVEYSTWGENSTTHNGGTRPGLFYDLPECVAAFEARQHYRR